jgi:hypothetical protein
LLFPEFSIRRKEGKTDNIVGNRLATLADGSFLDYLGYLIRLKSYILWQVW